MILWIHEEKRSDKHILTWRKQSSGMWHRVEVVLIDVSEERIASILRVEGKIFLFSTPHLHGATPQKTASFTVTAVKTSNLTF
jgi:hypothetical protein